ncbi:MAG TPA: thrombospondin type 3 repeat-containing protein, partial [bacterium]|nr:thrombospondin type 3 repeat-containing protein [bacterium]
MKKGLFLIFVFLFYAGLSAQVSEYEHMGSDPTEVALGGFSEAAQGITSDRDSYWYYSNQWEIRKYDYHFDNNYARGELDEFNSIIDGTGVSCDHIGGINYVDGYVYAGVDQCSSDSSYIVKFRGSDLAVVDYAEFVTPEGDPIDSAASVAYNPVDGLFYNQCPANITLNADEKERNLNSICGFAFNGNGNFLVLKSIIDLGVEHPRFLTSSWVNQGGAFAENGVFLYVQDDEHAEDSNMTGFHVYAPDYGKFRQDDGTGIKKYNAERFAMGNLSYNPQFSSLRLHELEGITVWMNSQSWGADIHILELQNNVGADYIWLHHFEAGDDDEDGINDMIDNCPLDYNPDQLDTDEDKTGNVCDDDDENDGVPDIDDNCPLIDNPDQKDWNGGLGDACQDYDGDGWYDYEDACPDEINTSACMEIHSTRLSEYQCEMAIRNGTNDPSECWEEEENCRESDSECCLTARLICDMDGDGRWDLEPEEEYGIDNYAYSASGDWSKVGGDNITINRTTSNTFGGTWLGTQEAGRKLSVRQHASYFCGQTDAAGNKTDADLSTYYCYCGKNDDAHLECRDEGDCGKDHANPNEAWDYVQGHATWQPVFSEFPELNPGEKSACVKKGVFIKEKSYEISKVWDFRNDKYLKALLTDADLDLKDNPDELRANGTYPMLKLAQGAVVRNSFISTILNKDVKYIKTTGNDHEVNKNYFSNYKQTHILGDNDKGRLLLAKQNEQFVDIIVEEAPYFRGIIIPGYGKWWYSMMSDYLGIKPWQDPETWEYGFEDRVKKNLYESIMRPSEFSKVGFDGNSISLKEVSFNDDYNQIFSFCGRNAAYFMKDGEFSIAFTDVNGIFNNVSPVSNGVSMRSAAVTVMGAEIFMAAGFRDMAARSAQNQTDIDNAEQMPERSAGFAKISFSENGAYMTALSPLPWEPAYISLFE